MPNNVRIGVQTTGVGKASSDVDRLRDKFDKLQKQGAKGFGIGLGAAAGLAAFNALGPAIGAVGDLLGESIDEASALNETMSKSNVVFGTAARSVANWGDTTAEAMGIAKRDAIEAAATFGNLFNQIGAGQDESAAMSKRLVQLAADLASFNNIDPTVALEKLRSGLSGEAEPLRAVGVFLNEAKVKAKALKLGLVGTHGELSEGAKIIARYHLILEETTSAQGDFTRTSDGLANSQRALNAQSKDREAILGEKLLPAQLAMTQAQIDLIDSSEQLVAVLGMLSTAGAGGQTLQWGQDLAQTLMGVDEATLRLRSDAEDAAMGVREAFVGSGSMSTAFTATAETFDDMVDSMKQDADRLISDAYDPIIEKLELWEDVQALKDLHAEVGSKKATIAQQKDIAQLGKSITTHLANLAEAGEDTSDAYKDAIKELKDQISKASGPMKARLREILALVEGIAGKHTVTFNVRTSQLLNSGKVQGIGTFHQGGTVPGPPGSEQLIRAKAGEEVHPKGEGGGGITVNVMGDVRADSPERIAEVVRRLKAIA